MTNLATAVGKEKGPDNFCTGGIKLKADIKICPRWRDRRFGMGIVSLMPVFMRIEATTVALGLVSAGIAHSFWL